MAAAEAAVSAGDLMTVKEEEGESSGKHKTEVILHLQPILRGLSEDTADTGTTVLAIETHHDDSEAEGEEVEYGYPITCGESRAVLLFKKFVCPGINVRCVKFNQQLISPKQFVHLAGKATLKDWKRAIRVGGVMLRKMMDSGQIDFYQHDIVCSNTCRSTKFDVLINSSRVPPGSAVQPSPPPVPGDPLGGQLPPLTGEIMHDAAEVEDPFEDRFGAAAEWSPGPVLPLSPATANGHGVKRKRADTADGALSLWKGVADIGLMGEVLSSIQAKLLATLQGVEVRSEKANLQEADAAMLNSLCETFGLLDSVKNALELKRCLMLGETLDEHRRQGYKSTRPHHHAPSLLLTHPAIQPLSVAALSASSLAQLTTIPPHFAHFSPSVPGRRHRGTGVVTPEREAELGEREDDASGMCRNATPRAVKLGKDLRLIGEDFEETGSFHDIEKLVAGRKGSKKHRSKREGGSVRRGTLWQEVKERA
ncbi:glucocorticoid modulatory element-binding protein 1-like isoform X2 [Genypterus blacodes]|uniref:glucocorticoid modulatory element-binding protein 1-like isoform X2 n=1 Tax=Genypterus blacodes TaxID=154954 RepID=UPI003F773185